MSFRLTKKNILHQKRDFLEFYKTSRVKHCKLFSVYYRKNDLDYPRLGITLKGRYASVSRTRIKRVVREWFRLRKMAFINMDLNVVVKAPPQFNKLFLDSLRNDLEKIEQKP